MDYKEQRIFDAEILHTGSGSYR